MNKDKLNEILEYGKGVYRVYEDDRGNRWQIVPKEEYDDMVDELNDLRRIVREYVEEENEEEPEVEWWVEW